MGINIAGTLYINIKHIPLLVEFKKLAAAECNGIMVMKWRDKTEYLSYPCSIKIQCRYTQGHQSLEIKIY